MVSPLHDEVLVLTVVLCGVLCVGGYMLTFALSRRLLDNATRPVIGLAELVKPMAFGMLLGLVILGYRLTEAPDDLMAAAEPQLSMLLPALLSVGLAGVCAGAWTARPRAVGRAITQADLVRRLCIAGNTHEDATARIAVRIALAAGYDPANASNLMVAASLHDVGRASIPQAILDKHGALDAAEERTVQEHTRIGHRMLAQSHEPMLDLAADIALHHHERWDGRGYPMGLSGTHIPLTSRAVALAAALDRLLSPDAALPAVELARHIQDGAGSRFDPRLVALLLADLPGMVAARNSGATPAPRAQAVLPVAAWLRPARLRLLPEGVAG